MARNLRDDRSGVASTVATIFSILVMLLFIDLAVVEVVPRQQRDAEYRTTESAISSFESIRGAVRSVLITNGPGIPGPPLTIGVPLGTEGVSPLHDPTTGTLRFESRAGAAAVAVQFVPHFNGGAITKIDQDVVLAIDSSGSMAWNDPQRLRISGAQEYIGRLACPDHVAIIDFDSVSRLIRGHHLTTPGHNCFPDFTEPQSDVDLIDSSGATNFGSALQLAVNELAGYGNPNHARIVILLTDGENSQPWMDALARAEARRARDRGFIVFTIGLGDADDALLQEIADVTGGTFYDAPDARSIRWIYYEISRRFSGAFACGDLSSIEGGSGRLVLQLANIQFPRQTITYEAGGVVRRQPDGSRVVAGPMMEWRADPRPGAGGALDVDLISLTGKDWSVVGSGTEFVRLRAEGVETEVIEVTRVNLTDVALALDAESESLDEWTAQGAATFSANAAVQGPLRGAITALDVAHTRQMAGNYTGAKFSVDSGYAQISAAIAAAQQEAEAGTMQDFLADSVTDALLLEGCRLTQWRNWYDGITIRVESADADAWEAWLNRTATELGMQFVLSRDPTGTEIAIRAVDQLSVNRRVVSVALSGDLTTPR